MLKKLLNKNVFLFVIVFISFTVKISAQTDLKTALSNVEKNTIDGKFDEALKELDALYKKNKSNSLNTVMIYGSYVNVYSNKKEFEKAFYYSSLAKDISDKTPDKLDDAHTLHAFAKIYLINQLYDKTISYSNKALNILKKFPDEHLLKSRLYSLMSLTHSRTNVYSEEYKNYVLEAVSHAQQQKEPLQLLGAYTEATLMYISAYEKTKNDEDLKNIFKYAELTLSYINENNVKTLPKKAIATAYNNMASLVNTYPYKNYSKQEKFKIAEDYLKKAIEVANETNDHSSLLICYATFAEIQENQNNNDLAEEYYLKSYELAKNKENINKLYALSYITSAISNLYKKQNKTAEALKFSEETLKYTKQSYEQLLDNKKKFLEAYYNTEQKNQQIKQLEEKNSIYTKQRLLYIGIIALALAGVVFLIYLIRYRQKLNKQKTDLLEAEKNETQLTLQLEQEEKARLKVEQELLALQQEQLQKQALATSLQLNHKTSFINELKEKIKEDKHVNIDRILKDEKLTDDDFNEVQNLVQDVHPNFFKRLNESSVNKLSNQDLKYAAYIYLNMDNQQIANILKVEPKTVRMTKYRMKQKMGLDKDIDLATFIQNLEL